jgi:hypothetical protein
MECVEDVIKRLEDIKQSKDKFISGDSELSEMMLVLAKEIKLLKG